jgi:ABC-2 type transport system permease protein
MNNLRRNLKAVYARAYVRIVGMNREPSWVVFTIFLPLLSVAAFVYVYKATAPPEIINSLLARVIIGGAMLAFWMNVLWGMGNNFYYEKELGNLDLYLMAPISKTSILLGMALGGMFSTTIRAIATILLGAVLFNVSFTLESPLSLGLVFLMTLTSLYGLGMLFASLFLMYGRGAWHTANLMQEPIFILSGFYFPIKFLGFFIALLASFIPLTLGIDAMNQLLGGSFAKKWSLLPVNLEILILTGLTAVFFALAVKALNFMETMSKKEGRLTLRYM